MLSIAFIKLTILIVTLIIITRFIFLFLLLFASFLKLLIALHFLFLDLMLRWLHFKNTFFILAILHTYMVCTYPHIIALTYLLS